MIIDIGKTIRLSEILDARDGRALFVDTSIAATLGATAGLENLGLSLEAIHHFCDGIIVNPGQAEHQAGLLGGKNRAAAIVRVDWTNAFRDDQFALPATQIKRLMISTGEDALLLGASAVVANLLLGFDDELEAQNIADLSHLARGCQAHSLPVLIDIRPIGPAVAMKNREESIKLGISFMQELGADLLIIPECSNETLKFIIDWVKVPVLLRKALPPSPEEIAQWLQMGVAGLVLSENIFVDAGYEEKIARLFLQLHTLKG